jgi:phage shock protein A
MELRELVFSKEPYEMFNVGTAAVMALFDKNDELVRQLADEKADHQSSLDAWSENLKKVGERKDALEIELAEANDRYVLLTDELWAVLGSEDRRDYVVQVKELVAELADARKAAEWVSVEDRVKITDDVVESAFHLYCAGGKNASSMKDALEDYEAHRPQSFTLEQVRDAMDDEAFSISEIEGVINRLASKPKTPEERVTCEKSEANGYWWVKQDNMLMEREFELESNAKAFRVGLIAALREEADRG